MSFVTFSDSPSAPPLWDFWSNFILYNFLFIAFPSLVCGISELPSWLFYFLYCIFWTPCQIQTNLVLFRHKLRKKRHSVNNWHRRAVRDCVDVDGITANLGQPFLYLKTTVVNTGICRLWKCRHRSLDSFKNLSHSTQDRRLGSSHVLGNGGVKATGSLHKGHLVFIGWELSHTAFMLIFCFLLPQPLETVATTWIIIPVGTWPNGGSRRWLSKSHTAAKKRQSCRGSSGYRAGHSHRYTPRGGRGLLNDQCFILVTMGVTLV